MAYARYDKKCDWYIFWELASSQERSAVDSRDSQQLAIWHKDFRFNCSSFSYIQVLQMLRSGDYSEIPGFSIEHQQMITDCLSEFVYDVGSDYNF